MHIPRFAFVLVFQALMILAVAPAFSQETSSPRAADPAIWGIYSRLVGTTWNGPTGKLEWLWSGDGAIIERRQNYHDQVIRPGATPGSLVGTYGSGLNSATFDGRFIPGGSVLWIRRGLVKVPMRSTIVENRYRDEMVKLDGAGEVVKVKNEVWYDQTGGQAVGSSGVAVAQAPASGVSPVVETAAASAPTSPSAAPLNLRGFERFVGKRLYSADDDTLLDVSRSADGGAVIRSEKFDGTGAWRYVVAPSAKKPGKWEMRENGYGDKHFRTVEWPSDTHLEVSSKNALLGGWFHNYSFVVDGETLTARRWGHEVSNLGMATGQAYDGRVIYTVMTDAAFAKLRAERAAAAAVLAKQQAEAQRLQKEAEGRAAALWLQRWNKLQEIAATDPWAAEAFAAQHGLPYTNPLRPVENAWDGEEEEEAPEVSPMWQALQDMNAAASASEARSRAALDATMQQAARQAAYERDLAAQREQQRRADDARRAREATERQYEIARQFEAQQEAQRQAREQAQRAAAAPAPAAGSLSARPVAAAVSQSRCEMIHPKVNDTYNTVKGDEFGRKYLRDRAEASCLSRTGNAGIDGDATCTADGPHVWKCKILVQCAGTMRSPSCASNAQ
jgi:hypothetical protein